MISAGLLQEIAAGDGPTPRAAARCDSLIPRASEGHLLPPVCAELSNGRPYDFF